MRFIHAADLHLDSPLAGFQEDVADESVADHDPDMPFVDVASLDVADKAGRPRAVLVQGAGGFGQVVSFVIFGASPLLASMSPSMWCSSL